MKEQLKKILAGKCHNKEATNRAVEEVYNLIESNQKELEKENEYLRREINMNDPRSDIHNL